MKEQFNSLKQVVVNHKIVVGLFIAIFVVFVMTFISISIYNTSDVAQLDISRPGYEKLRNSVIKGNETITFSATGTLDMEDMKDFQNQYDEKRKSLNAIGKFDGDILDADQLKLTSQQ